MFNFQIIMKFLVFFLLLIYSFVILPFVDFLGAEYQELFVLNNRYFFSLSSGG